MEKRAWQVDDVRSGGRGGLINPSNLRQRSSQPFLDRARLPQITLDTCSHMLPGMGGEVAKAIEKTPG